MTFRDVIPMHEMIEKRVNKFGAIISIIDVADVLSDIAAERRPPSRWGNDDGGRFGAPQRDLRNLSNRAGNVRKTGRRTWFPRVPSAGK